MVVATGFFDGVHLGHREVIRQLVSAANNRGTQSVVVTFWPHPRKVLQDEAQDLRLLNSLSEKTALLKNAGVDNVEVIEFTKEFSALTAERYLEEYVRGKFGADTIILGYDNRMGSDASSVEGVAQIASRLGLNVIKADCFNSGGVAVSSTKIRQFLEEGRVDDASKMLSYDYMLDGVVVRGNQLGRTIGFPTANMQLYEPLKLVPANGVYQVNVLIGDRDYKGMCNIGIRPTVCDKGKAVIETHIIDFEEEIYGMDIRVSFLKKIRDEIKFPSLDALKIQLEKDRNSLYL